MIYRLRMALICLLAGRDAVALNLTLSGAIHLNGRPLVYKRVKWLSRYPNVGINA